MGCVFRSSYFDPRFDFSFQFDYCLGQAAYHKYATSQPRSEWAHGKGHILLGCDWNNCCSSNGCKVYALQGAEMVLGSFYKHVLYFCLTCSNHG